MRAPDRVVGRRRLLRLAVVGAAASLLSSSVACQPAAPATSLPDKSGPGTKAGPGTKSGAGVKGSALTPTAAPPAAGGTPPARTVRLSSVVTPKDGGLYDDLIPDFERRSGYTIELVTGEDVYGPARAGRADVVVAHYGHHETEAFITEGLGEWPRAVFANSLALLGPPADPAGVRGLSDVTEAYRRIARTKSTYVVNAIDGIEYLSEVIWHAAGSPEKSGWLLGEGAREQDAVALAAQKGGYVLWGLTPFLRTQQTNKVALEPLVLGDPLLQRVLVSVAVKPDRVPGANAAAAAAFQAYLLSPPTQARVQAFRLPGIDRQVWWPSARHNKSAHLPQQ